MENQKKIEDIYQKFLGKLDLLSKKQDDLIREFREKLETERILQLKKELE